MSTIFVYNVPERIEGSDIFNEFSRYGRVINVQREGNVYSVTFEDNRDANEAMRMNGTQIGGQTIRVSDHTTPVTTPIQSPIPEDLLYRESFKTLLKQLYGIPVQLPEFLTINGIRANFISFQQISGMLQRNEIERYIVDPLLQPWAGVPGTGYRIFTFFGKNGITYLVRGRYDQRTNQILP